MTPRPHLAAIPPAAILLIAALLAFTAAGAARAQTDPVSVLVAAGTDASGARVTLTFSRPVEYRLQETRSRLRVLLTDPVVETSRIDRELSGDVLKRVRFDDHSRGTDIIFYLGREFDTFTGTQLADPFRIVLRFQRAGAPPPGQDDPEGGGESSPGGADPSSLPEGSAEGAAPGGPGGSGAVGPAGNRLPDSPPGVIRNVVIDPGHGGTEEGAVGSAGLKEKDLVLDLARRLRERLVAADFAVALTREQDETLDLTSRTAIANHNHADLFISIHANSSSRAAARGAETFFLSYGGDEDALALARKENRPWLTSGGREGEGVDLVLWEMAQAEHLSRSSALAELLQQELNDLAGIRDRGVKQAPFRVLVGAAMPAVLIEVGFLSNGEEERQLASDSYRDQIADAIATAVGRFRSQTGRDEGLASSTPPGSPR